MKITILTFFFLALSFGVPAQETPLPATSILTIQKGFVMTLVDGYYQTARNGQTVKVGDSVMVAEGAHAFVMFDKNCRQDLRGPNTFILGRTCNSAAYLAPEGAKDAGVITGSALLGAAVLNGLTNAPPPLSAGPRLTP